MPQERCGFETYKSKSFMRAHPPELLATSPQCSHILYVANRHCQVKKVRTSATNLTTTLATVAGGKHTTATPKEDDREGDSANLPELSGRFPAKPESRTEQMNARSSRDFVTVLLLVTVHSPIHKNSNCTIGGRDERIRGS